MTFGVRGELREAAWEDVLEEPADCFLLELDPLFPRPLYLSPFDLPERELASTVVVDGEGDEKNLFLKLLMPNPGDRSGVLGVTWFWSVCKEAVEIAWMCVIGDTEVPGVEDACKREKEDCEDRSVSVATEYGRLCSADVGVDCNVVDVSWRDGVGGPPK